MNIVVTAKEAIERGWFVPMARELGLNVHALSPDKEITLTEEKLNNMGLYLISKSAVTPD
ncbi:hypothetical protein SD71_16105 [Cohnella kolymensis]|uniref:D-isomer specific 2-hydroxyacid dehydrogenase catalytic domain-containing protein n=1 Tax=Cohnella kolymensis TaxID=1590652 RepID=A0ABR5A271_9BACL|nr:hypothetical protein [Cohnella kolymensis]KIL35149.1 hypothetical protein SD71_16105 [Cohnella kolymensis]